MLASSLKENKFGQVKEALAIRLQNKEIMAKGSFLTDSEAITEAAKADAVILVEEKNVSKNKDIERMAETLSISKANVIGAVVL